METSQKKLFDQIFRPPRGREGHKKWFEIVHWVVLNVFDPFNPHIMMCQTASPQRQHLCFKEGQNGSFE